MIIRSILAAVLFFSASAQANIVYEWEGPCTFNCVGSAHATIQYGSGFLSFPAWMMHYEDSVDSVQFGPQIITVRGVPGEGFSLCAYECYDWFGSTAAGAWHVLFETASSVDFCCGIQHHEAWGIGSTFTLVGAPQAVPEPQTLALLALGLLGLVASRRTYGRR